MNDSVNATSNYDKRSIRDNLKFVLWVFVWTASSVISQKAKYYGWWEAEWITLLSIAVNAALGLLLVYYYRQMLNRMDDLQRKIHLEAISISFGLGLVLSISYTILVTWGYIINEQVSDIFTLMCISYAAAIVLNTVRYK
jgi:hypothetical protein